MKRLTQLLYKQFVSCGVVNTLYKVAVMLCQVGEPFSLKHRNKRGRKTPVRWAGGGGVRLPWAIQPVMDFTVLLDRVT